MPIHGPSTTRPRAAQPRTYKIGVTACLCIAFSASAHANIRPNDIEQLEAGLQGFPRQVAAIPAPNRQALDAAARRLANRNTQAAMRNQGWDADTVIAYYNGAPITVRRALAADGISSLPPLAFLEAFQACLSRYGFEHTHMNTHDIEQAHRLPRGMLNAISMVESRNYNCATSASGMMGRYQFNSVTIRGLGLGNPYNAYEAANVAARHLAEHIRRGSIEIAIATFNCGVGCVAANKAQHGGFRVEYLPARTQHYVRSVSGAIETTPPPSAPTATRRPAARRT